MSYEPSKSIARRQVLGAGVAGAALLVLPDGCSSGSAGSGDASGDIKPLLDAGCPAAGYTKRLSIADVGVAKQGTSYEFSDSCYADPFCFQDRILVIHPVTKDVYVAMSGSCTHQCCDNTEGSGGPKYYKTLSIEEEAGAPAPEAGPVEGGTAEAGDAATHDAGIVDAASRDASDGGTAEAGTMDAGTHDATIHDAATADAGAPDAEDEGGITVTYTDVLFCDCHGSIYSALDGTVIRGPASQTLQQLKVSESDGNLIVTIPKS
jgi:Rieske Fe-S protein